ncbi:phage tail-collar fiber domain-containing protein [Citrobacter sedlakii]|uniref:phage tail-collar fiber domain-containing protein n=1 Tax=Citrobacter sedlakii TaxID=67826 RepID=UPI0033156F44
MSKKFKTIITTDGAEKLAAATVPGGKKVNLTAMAVGDGGGTLPEPDASQTKLINEVWRHALNKISQDNKNKNYIVAELVIPPEVGGFWIRELGLYDDAGTLIAVANMAESYKPELAEGSGRAQTCRMVIIVSSIASVELSIDATTVIATQDYVDDKLAEHEQSRRHPDATLKEKGFVQLSNATDSTSEALAATPKAVKAAYDLAGGKYTAQDATTAQKGIVKLSSATDSTSEALAATPKAVKAAYDLASGKYTAQDANTAQKGIVKLSSATDSESELLAATPKAVKAANDNANGRVPSGRKVNGKALAGDINITSQDIFNGQAVGIGNAVDLNSYTTPGLYYQPQNEQAKTGKNYPEALAGSLEIYKHAGITQIYRLYGNSRSYIRALYGGVWSEWAKQYDTENKPTAADTGAVAKTGDTMNGLLTINNNDAGLVLKPVTTGRVSYILGRNLSGSSDWNVGRTGSTGVALSNYVGGTGVQILDDGSVRINGGSSTANIRVQGDLNPTSFNTFDGRYNLKNTASKAINGWHKDSSTGVIRQWGIVNVTDNTIVTANFPIPFPGACASMNVTPISQAANSSAEIISAYGKAISNSQMRVAACANWDNHGISGVYFEATGY